MSPGSGLYAIRGETPALPARWECSAANSDPNAEQGGDEADPVENRPPLSLGAESPTLAFN
jgi:hypothetical protein